MTSNAARRQRAAASRSGAPEPTTSSSDGMWRLRGPDGTIAPGWYLVPLRLFLGVTFLFAGLQKLSNPAFLRNSAPGSIHAQMAGATHTSPIGSLLGHLTGVSALIGVLIALGEVAVGVGALLGLLTRVAAIGGVLLSLSLFLAISFRTSPYYTGADIVFLFAWTPFVLAGAAGAPALDTWLAERPASSAPAVRGSGPVSRRDVVSRGAVLGLVAGGTAVLVAVVAGIGRVLAPSTTASSAGTLPAPGTPATTAAPATTTTGAGATATSAPTTTNTTAAAPKGTAIGPASSVPVGGSASFTDPNSGDPSLVIQQRADHFAAFDAICPHAGCTVAYQSGANIITCPCHGSEFDPTSGAVMLGPATSGLTPIKVVKGANGDLYVV